MILCDLMRYYGDVWGIEWDLMGIIDGKLINLEPVCWSSVGHFLVICIAHLLVVFGHIWVVFWLYLTK